MTAPQSTYNRHKPRNINSEHRANLGLQDRIALAITTAVGTMYAVYLFVALLAGWMVWQGMVSNKPFDPYPFAFFVIFGQHNSATIDALDYGWPKYSRAPR